MYQVIRKFERVADAVTRKAIDSRVGAASLHEAAGRIGAMASYIKPIYGGMRLCGPAFTVKMHVGDNLMLHCAIAEARPGDNGGGKNASNSHYADGCRAGRG